MSARELEWSYEDKFEVSGRGTVYTGRYPFDRPRSEVMGMHLRVGGHVMRIDGIEWYAVMREPKRGDPIGFLLKIVEEIKKTEIDSKSIDSVACRECGAQPGEICDNNVALFAPFSSYHRERRADHMRVRPDLY